MGRGNLIPKGDLAGYKYFYVSNELIYGEDYYTRDDYGIMNMEFEEWRENLWYEIKNRWESFDRGGSIKKGKWRYSRGHSSYVLCSNGLVNIELEDGETYFMIAIVIPGGLMDSKINLAYRHMYNYYDGLIEIFKEWYEEDFLEGKLRVRSSPWTSAPIAI